MPPLIKSPRAATYYYYSNGMYYVPDTPTATTGHWFNVPKPRTPPAAPTGRPSRRLLA
jgi:hypothetical protein